MPRYFFDVKDGHRLFDKSGFVCEDDIDAIKKATVLAIGVSVDNPEDDPERRVAIINDEGHEDWQRARVFQTFVQKSRQTRLVMFFGDGRRQVSSREHFTDF